MSKFKDRFHLTPEQSLFLAKRENQPMKENEKLEATNTELVAEIL